jgi:hypothetical protein
MLGICREDAVERLSSVLLSFRDRPPGDRRGRAARPRRRGLRGVVPGRRRRAAGRAKASGRGRVLPAGAQPTLDAEPDLAAVGDGALAERLRRALSGAGYRCVVRPDGRSGFTVLLSHSTDREQAYDTRR